MKKSASRTDHGRICTDSKRIKGGPLEVIQQFLPSIFLAEKIIIKRVHGTALRFYLLDQFGVNLQACGNDALSRPNPDQIVQDCTLLSMTVFPEFSGGNVAPGDGMFIFGNG